MGLTEKAKELADSALLKAGEMSGTARDKAPDYLDRAADLAVKGMDAAASSVDRATGGRYHDRLKEVTGKVENSLDRPRPGEAPPTVVVEPDEAPPAAGGDTTDPGGPTRTP